MSVNMQTFAASTAKLRVVGKPAAVLISCMLYLLALLVGQKLIGPYWAALAAEVAAIAAFVTTLARNRNASLGKIGIVLIAALAWSAVCMVVGLRHEAAHPSPYPWLLYGGSQFGPAQVFLDQLAATALFCLVAWTARDADRRDTLVSAIELSAGCITGLALVEAVAQYSPDLRLEAGFTNPNLFAAFLGLTMPFTAARIANGRGGLASVAFRCLQLAGMLVCLVLTHSRGAEIGFAAGMLVVGTAWARSGGVWMRERTRMVVAVALMFALLGGFAVLHHGHTGVDHSRSDAQRMVAWHAGFAIARDHALFGVGLGGFASAMQGLHLYEANPDSPTGYPLVPADHLHAHNIALQITAERGIVGLALLALCAVLLCSRVRDAVKRGIRGDAAVGASACLIALGCQNVVDYTLWYSPVLLVAAIVFGILWSSRTGTDEDVILDVSA